MAKSSITALEIQTCQERAGFLGRRTVSDEMLRMETSGGCIYLRKSTVEDAGDSWPRFKRRLSGLAREKGIPYQDTTI